jgi:hypothetical protein
LPTIPDSFELRVARALASFSLHEIPVKRGPDLTARLQDAQKRWSDFCREVAREAASSGTGAHRARRRAVRGLVRGAAR